MTTEITTEITNLNIDPAQMIRKYLNDNFSFDHKTNTLSFTFPSELSTENFIKTIGKIKYERKDNNVSFKSINIIDVIGVFYPINYSNDLLYSILLSLIQFNNKGHQLPTLVFFKNDPSAIIPSKAHYSDAGYDLTIIKKVKDIGKNIAMYDTGISLQIPLGYYVEIHPRSSLSKSGYILSNLCGVIDNGYTGNLFICLTRVDDSIKPFVLPFQCCQMILKKSDYCHFVEGVKDNVVETSRSAGGFGSSDKKE